MEQWFSRDVSEYFKFLSRFQHRQLSSLLILQKIFSDHFDTSIYKVTAMIYQ